MPDESTPDTSDHTPDCAAHSAPTYPTGDRDCQPQSDPASAHALPDSASDALDRAMTIQSVLASKSGLLGSQYSASEEEIAAAGALKITPVCFWSGKDLDPNADPAWKRSVMSYDPHPEVDEAWKQGIVLVEVSMVQYSPEQPPINPADQQEGATSESATRDPLLYPSGRWLVVPPELTSNLFEAEPAARINKTGRAFLDTVFFSRLIELLKADSQIPPEALDTIYTPEETAGTETVIETTPPPPQA